MSATTLALGPSVITPEDLETSALRQKLRDLKEMTKRNLLHIRREPMQLSDVTIQPVLFTMLFVYVFGAGFASGTAFYKQFAIAGLIAMNLATSSVGTAVGLSTDLKNGIIDRFRTMPMWRPAVLAGRAISDLLAAFVCMSICMLAGLAIGWRPETSAWSVIGGMGLALLFSFAISWAVGCVGLWMDDPESAQNVGFIVLFPLSFVSTAFVPSNHMTPWLRDVANWNPVSSLAGALRNLFGNPNPASTIHSWPMQHPAEATLVWGAVLLAAFVPLAVWLFRKRTIG